MKTSPDNFEGTCRDYKLHQLFFAMVIRTICKLLFYTPCCPGDGEFIKKYSIFNLYGLCQKYADVHNHKVLFRPLEK